MKFEFKIVSQVEEIELFYSEFYENRHVFFTKPWLKYLLEFTNGKLLIVKILQNDVHIGYFASIEFKKSVLK